MSHLTFEQFLLEMPQHYPSKIIYQKDSKFQQISVRNISDYIILGESQGMVYTVHPNQTFGFVFDVLDLTGNAQFATPVMHVSLRETPIKNYKQAHNLRIRESYGKVGVASNWYDLYIKTFGGIVSDAEHLEGGKTLWYSFIKRSTTDPQYNVSLVDANTGEVLIDKATTETPQEQIWSNDATNKHKLLVYTYNQ